MSDDLRELLGAYALDAVDDEERRQVEELLAVDARARAEVSEHREVATLLAYTGAPAPAGLWQRIAESLEGDDDAVPPPPLTLSVAPSADARGTVVPLQDRSRRRRPFGSWVAGAAAAGVIAVLGVTVVNQGNRIQDFERSRNTPSLAEAAAYVLADPNANRVELTSADGGLRIPAAVEPDGTGFLVGYDLPALPDDRTYQLWGVVDGRVISLGVLGTDPAVIAFSVDGRPSALVITEEERGGVPVSEQPAALQGTLS